VYLGGWSGLANRVQNKTNTVLHAAHHEPACCTRWVDAMMWWHNWLCGYTSKFFFSSHVIVFENCNKYPPKYMFWFAFQWDWNIISFSSHFNVISIFNSRCIVRYRPLIVHSLPTKWIWWLFLGMSIDLQWCYFPLGNRYTVSTLWATSCVGMESRIEHECYIYHSI
jgi:hypothetical protein